MTGFVCETIWLNKLGLYEGKPPLIRLIGDKLIIRELDYCNSKEIVADLQNDGELGSNCSKRKIGKTQIEQLGVDKLPTLGMLPYTDFNIHRKINVLGEVNGKIFGQNGIKKIGITKKNSCPPRAILVPPAKPFMKAPKNYWKQTLASDIYKKISDTFKKFFEEAK